MNNDNTPQGREPLGRNQRLVLADGTEFTPNGENVKRQALRSGALRLADLGPVLFTQGKQPAHGGNGHLDARQDPAGIDSLLRRSPGADGVALSLRLSGIVVVDDDGDGCDGLDLPRTRTHRTSSGGSHYVYRLPPGTEGRRVIRWSGRDLDVLGDGYVVVYGPGRTVLDESAIAPAPSWVVDAMLRPEPLPLPTIPYQPPTTTEGSTRLEGWTLSAVRGLLTELAAEPRGSRNRQLHRAACRLRDFYAAGLPGTLSESEAMSELLRCCASNGLVHDGEEACRKTIRSAWRAPAMPVRLPDFSVVTEGEWCKSAGHFDLDPEEVREVIAAAMSCTLHDVQALDGVHPARRATLARVHSTLLTRAHTVGSLSIRYSSLQLAMDSDCSEKSIRGALDDLAELGWNRTKGGIVGDSVTCTIWTWEPVGTFAPRAHVARHGALLKVLGATGESGAKVSVTEVGNALAVGLRRRDGDLAGCGAYTAHALDFILQNPDGVDERMLTEHLGVVPQTSRRKLSRFALRGIVVATTKATGGRPSFWYTWSADTAAIVRASKIGERVIRNYQAAIDVSRWRMGQAKALAKRLGCTLAVALARLGERIDTVIKGIRSWARVRKGDQAPVQLSARGEFRANMRARAPSLAA